jgi:archaellum biogenesis protein FlaJ (TadC family)
MPSKLKTAKMFLNIYGAILLVFGLVLGFGFIIAGIFFPGDRTRDANLAGLIFGSFMGIFFLLVMGGWGAFHLITARALERRKHWAKTATIVLGILMLGSFPIGTIFGVFTLVGIFDSESETWLENKTQVAAAQHTHAK